MLLNLRICASQLPAASRRALLFVDSLVKSRQGRALRRAPRSQAAARKPPLTLTRTWGGTGLRSLTTSAFPNPPPDVLMLHDSLHRERLSHVSRPCFPMPGLRACPARAHLGHHAMRRPSRSAAVGSQPCTTARRRGVPSLRSSGLPAGWTVWVAPSCLICS